MRSTSIRVVALSLLASMSFPLNASGQFSGERSTNSGIWSSPRLPPQEPPPATAEVELQVPQEPGTEKYAAENPSFAGLVYLPGEVHVNVEADARAAVIGDSTRMQNFSGGSFLPSSIPVPGDPYFGSGSRAMLQGNGNSLGLIGTLHSDNNDVFQIGTKFLLQNANFGAGDASVSGSDGNVAIQQAYGRYNGLLVGVMDTAFADSDALPEILDLAGPNARVTAFENGIGEGQARLSYYVLQPETAGTSLNVSIENPVPEIDRPSDGTPAGSFDTFARCPDFLAAARYGNGTMWGEDYVESGHLQFGTVLRSLGLENEDGTDVQTALGWGLALSGSYRFLLNPELSVRDAVFGSIAYGEGIGHYIVDLRSQDAALNNNDAAISATGELEALPALAWYSAYQHNWSDNWRSTATYSQVMLQSIDVTPMDDVSPYHLGQYVQANLVYHTEFFTNDQPEPTPHTFFTGLEWTHGRKETLDGSTGSADRIMWVAAFTK